MVKLERIIVIEHPLHPNVDYVVYRCGDRTLWYRVDYENEHEETWEHIPALA